METPNHSGRSRKLSEYPRLVAEFDFAANDPFTPDNLTYGSKRTMWWVCPNGPDHRYEMRVKDRTRSRGRGCPCCVGKSLSVTNCLATVCPEVAAQLHPELNDGLTARDIMAGSSTPVVWKCPGGPDHIWEAPPNDRVNVASGTVKSGCGYCRGLRPSVTNSLASLHPEIAAELMPAPHNSKTAEEVVAGSNEVLVWKCDEGPDHIWKATSYDRADGHGCPACTNRQLSVTNSIAAVAPHLAEEVDPELNGGRTAHDIVAGTDEPIWWRCCVDTRHVWRVRPAGRLQSGSECPRCTIWGRSKQEIELLHELALFLNVDPYNPSRLDAWPQGDVDGVDHSRGLVIEWDGGWHHRDPESVARDRRKTIALQAAGWTVIRGRSEPLQRIGPDDVMVPHHATTHERAVALLRAVERALGVELAGLDEYEASGEALAAEKALRHIAALLDEDRAA